MDSGSPPAARCDCGPHSPDRVALVHVPSAQPFFGFFFLGHALACPEGLVLGRVALAKLGQERTCSQKEGEAEAEATRGLWKVPFPTLSTPRRLAQQDAVTR